MKQLFKSGVLVYVMFVSIVGLISYMFYQKQIVDTPACRENKYPMIYIYNNDRIKIGQTTYTYRDVLFERNSPYPGSQYLDYFAHPNFENVPYAERYWSYSVPIGGVGYIVDLKLDLFRCGKNAYKIIPAREASKLIQQQISEHARTPIPTSTPVVIFP